MIWILKTGFSRLAFNAFVEALIYRKCFGFVTLIYLNRREYIIVVNLIYVNFINHFSLYLFQYLLYLLLIFIFALFSFGLSLSGRLKRSISLFRLYVLFQTIVLYPTDN